MLRPHSGGQMIRVALRTLLEERGMSQRELARRTDSHPEVISRFAREATNGVSYDVLDRICSALDCTPGDLLKYVPEQFHLFDGGRVGAAVPTSPHQQTNGGKER